MSLLARGPVSVALEPDAEIRAQIARELKLVALPALSGAVTVRPWRDGAEIVGGFQGVVTQICGVSLEPFDQAVEGEIAVALVPKGSPNAVEPTGEEIELDPEAADPPDIAESDEIDLGAYLLEHLALEIDPFPRKPGAVFDYVPDSPEEGPFAALKKLKDQS
jgi:uncharacterized metal-binding protein YceD (DUF177 family)